MRSAVQLDAPFRELNRKRRRVRAFLFAALDCLVGNKPSVAATSQIASAGMRPARNIALVLIRDADCQSIDFDAANSREMKNVFVAIVQKSLRADGFEVANCAIVDGYRFDPVNRILQGEQIT